MIPLLAYLLLLVLASVGQFFLPHAPWLYDARLDLPLIIFLTAALRLPYPSLLLLALATGLLQDSLSFIPSPAGLRPEIPLGFTVLLYGLAGSLLQGATPPDRRQSWEIHTLAAPLAVLFIQSAEFLVLSLARGGLLEQPVLPPLRRILGCAALALAAAAPLWFLARHLIPVAIPSGQLGQTPETSTGKIRISSAMSKI